MNEDMIALLCGATPAAHSRGHRGPGQNFMLTNDHSLDWDGDSHEFFCPKEGAGLFTGLYTGGLPNGPFKCDLCGVDCDLVGVSRSTQ